MVTETATPSDAAQREVMASLDDDGRTERFIIADTTADGAWLSMPASESFSLPCWR